MGFYCNLRARAAAHNAHEQSRFCYVIFSSVAYRYIFVADALCNGLIFSSDLLKWERT